MASPAQVASIFGDSDTDYGSDFSPEEERIVEQLLSGQKVEIEDNPIVAGIEQHGTQQSLRVPRALGRKQASPLFEAARAAEKVAEQISQSVKRSDSYPDCESICPTRRGSTN
jgi:exonuclease V